MKAVAILLGVYLGAGYLWFFFMPPASLAPYYAQLPDWMRTLEAPSSFGLGASGQWQKVLLVLWSARIFVFWCGALGFGVLLAWVISALGGRRLARKVLSSGTYAGCFLTMGRILSPRMTLPKVSSRVKIKGVSFTRPQQALANEIMGLLAGTPGAYSGDGHGVTLYEHTTNLLEIVAEDKKPDPLLALAAMGHDLGKLVAYKKIGNAWQVVSDHGLASGRLLKLLPAFSQLPEDEAEVVHAAVRYGHCVDQLPMSISGRAKAERLIDALKKVDGRATAEEKEEVLSSRDAPKEILDAFWRGFGDMQFYRKNMPRGTKSVGWRVGKQLFMNEHALREWLQRRLDRDFAAAMGRIRRGGQIHKLTEHLLVQLYDAGQLVTSIICDGKRYTLPPEAALWTIRSGANDFNGVFIIKVDVDENTILPERAPFHIYPLRPATGELMNLAKVEVVDAEKVKEAKAEKKKAHADAKAVEKARPDDKKNEAGEQENKPKGGKKKGGKANKKAEQEKLETGENKKAGKERGSSDDANANQGKAKRKVPAHERARERIARKRAQAKGGEQAGNESEQEEQKPKTQGDSVPAKKKKQSEEVSLAARQAVGGEVSADIFSADF